MKHFILSAIIFVVLLAGSFTAHMYTKSIVNEIEKVITPMTTTRQVTQRDIYGAEKIKDIFFENKKMLRFFVNKEHIQKVEISILFLDDAAKNGNRDKLRENSLEIASMLDHIEGYLTAFN